MNKLIKFVFTITISFLFISNIYAKGEFDTKFLRNTDFLNNEIMASKMALNDEYNYTKVGTLVTIVSYTDKNEYETLKQIYYTNNLSSLPSSSYGQYRFKINSKFGNIDATVSSNNEIQYGNRNVELKNGDPSESGIKHDVRKYLTGSDYGNFLSIRAIKACSIMVYVEPIYIKSKKQSTSYNNLHTNCDIFSSANYYSSECQSYRRCTQNIRYDNSLCNNSECIRYACSDSSFKSKCQFQCTYGKDYSLVGAYLNPNTSTGATFTPTVINNEFKVDYLPTITLPRDEYGKPINKDNKNTGWGYSKIMYISPYDYDFRNIRTNEYDSNHREYELYEYCSYNFPTCSDGTVIRDCFKESKTEEVDKIYRCPVGYYECGTSQCCKSANFICNWPYTNSDGYCAIARGVKESYSCNGQPSTSSTCTYKVTETTCTSNFQINGNGKKCFALKDKSFSCPSGSSLDCKNETLSDGKTNIRICRCKKSYCKEYNTKTVYTYKMLAAKNCNGVAGRNQTYCSNCGYNSGGDGSCGSTNQVCCIVGSSKVNTDCKTTGYNYDEASCKSGLERTQAQVGNNGKNHYVRCGKGPKTKNSTETEDADVTWVPADCPSGSNPFKNDNSYCYLYTFYSPGYYTCDGIGGVGFANSNCLFYDVPRNTLRCPNGTIEQQNGKCLKERNTEEIRNVCKTLVCDAKCPYSSKSLTSCMKEARSTGVVIGGTNYKSPTYAGAYNICQIKEECNLTDCSSENDALQKISVSKDTLKKCILDSGSELLNASDTTKINEIVDRCKQKYCTSKCFSTSVDNQNVSCTNKYNISQNIEIKENSPTEESNTSTWCNTYPRISKYGRLLSKSGNCNLFCTQSSKISLPTNIFKKLNKLSYFEWPTRSNGKNYLQIETTNTCYIFTDTLNAAAKSCNFDKTSIKGLILLDDNPTIKLNDSVTLEKENTTESWNGDIVVNTNISSPKSFAYKTISNYIIPKNNNNVVSINKSGKRLSKILNYGVIQIDKNVSDGLKNLVLTFSKYGFDNQFGDIVNNYTCNYNVSKTPPPTCIECDGEYVKVNTSYHDDNNRIKVFKYVNASNTAKTCDYDYSCISSSKTGLDNALKNCVTTYFSAKNWKYNVDNINEGAHLIMALNHCTNICNIDVQRVIFREISTSEPFPGRSGNKRIAGTNWRGYENVAKVNNTSDALYEITLTGQNIKNIRTYNKTHDYDDWSISNTSGRSTFITNTNKTYIQNYKYNSKMKTTQSPIANCPVTK